MNLLLSGTSNYRNFARQTSNQLVIGERNCEMSSQFHSKANFQNFVQAIKSTNLQTHEPVHFKKTTKIEPHENKVFHSMLNNL